MGPRSTVAACDIGHVTWLSALFGDVARLPTPSAAQAKVGGAVLTAISCGRWLGKHPKRLYICAKGLAKSRAIKGCAFNDDILFYHSSI